MPKLTRRTSALVLIAAAAGASLGTVVGATPASAAEYQPTHGLLLPAVNAQLPAVQKGVIAIAPGDNALLLPAVQAAREAARR